MDTRDTKNSRAVITILALTLASSLVHSGSALAQISVDPSFQVEHFVDIPEPGGGAVAIAPGGSPFGSYLYVASVGTTIEEPDFIWRVDLATADVELFFQLPDESSPVDLAFGPGLPFTENLYISSNNRDGGLPGDKGGSIVFLEPDPSVNGELFLTPFPPVSNFLSEPNFIAFAPGGGFGTDLLVSNATNPPWEIFAIPPAGTPRGTFFSFGGNNPLYGLAFGPGAPFTSDLYVSYRDTGEVWTITTAGVLSLFTSIPGFDSGDHLGSLVFAPPGPFEKHLYSLAALSGQVALLQIEPAGGVHEVVRGFLGLSFSSSLFPTFDALAFAPDGQSLFVSDTNSGAVFRVSLAALEVTIDTKPGSDPNSINPRSRGLIPVGILTTSTADGDALDFDAGEIDSLSLAFGTSGAAIAHAQAHIEDLDGDGDLDMVAHFKTQDTGIACGDTEATLTGETLGGTQFKGTDSVRTVGCR